MSAAMLCVLLHRNLSVEDAIELGRRAIYHATFRDCASGGTVSGKLDSNTGVLIASLADETLSLSYIHLLFVAKQTLKPPQLCTGFVDVFVVMLCTACSVSCD
jgi:hypothetical protein